MDNKIDYIQLVIDYSNMDLDEKASLQTKAKVANIAADVIGGWTSVRARMSKMEEILGRYPLSDKEWNDLIAFQKAWGDALNWIVDRTKAPWQLELNIPVIFCWGGDELDGGDHFVYGPSPFNEDIEVVAEAYDLTSIPGKVFYGELPENHKEEKKFPKGALSFFGALSGFPASSLLRCPHCENVFFNPTKRKRVYCSPSCQKTAGVRRVREKQRASKK